MEFRRKEMVSAVAVAASVLACNAAGAAVHPQEKACYPNSGYLVSMQYAHTDRVIGTYYIKKMQALSLDSKGNVDTDQGHTLGAASMQLNTYLRGTEKNEKKKVYWIQDTVTFVYSKNGMEQYLSSEVYKFNSSGSEELVMSEASGKGSIFSSGSCTDSVEGPANRGKTYLYATRNMPSRTPQYGYLEMAEHLKSGRISIKISYWNDSLKRVDTYDTIVLGKKGEFTKAHFVSNSVLDTEMGFGGDGCGATAYFMKMKAYMGMYFYGKGASSIRYEDGQPSSAEMSANLECKYSGGMEEFYSDPAVDRKMLKMAARLYDEKVRDAEEHAK